MFLQFANEDVDLCLLGWVFERIDISIGAMRHVVLQFKQHAGLLPDLELDLVLQEVDVLERLLQV